MTIAIVMTSAGSTILSRPTRCSLTAAAFAPSSKFTFILSAGFVVAICLGAGRRADEPASFSAFAAY